VAKKPRFPRPYWAWRKTKIISWKKDLFLQGGQARILLKDGKNFRGLFFSLPCRIDRVGKVLHLAIQLKDNVRLCRYEEKLKSAIWEMYRPEDFRDFLDLPTVLDDPGLFTDFCVVPAEYRCRMVEELEKGSQTCLGFLLVPKKEKPRASAGAGHSGRGRKEFSPNFESRFPERVWARKS
jgi:hypothetical protein